MAVIALRTLLIYAIIIFSMRLMGKKQLGELQPSELVCTILISNLASIPLESPEIPLISSIMPVLLIVCIEIFISKISTHSHKFATLISGSPKIIISNGKIDTLALKELRFTVDDLLEALRGKDIYDIEEVNFALVETNGSVSVYKKGFATELTRKDLKLPSNAPATPFLPIITNGVINKEIMESCKLNTQWLNGKLSEERLSKDDVMLMLCNSDKEFKIIKKDA